MLVFGMFRGSLSAQSPQSRLVSMDDGWIEHVDRPVYPRSLYDQQLKTVEKIVWGPTP